MTLARRDAKAIVGVIAATLILARNAWAADDYIPIPYGEDDSVVAVPE